MLGVDANARPKSNVVTDDKLIAKLCHIINGTPQWAFKGSHLC